MSYSILIGNAELHSEWGAPDEEPIAKWTVASMVHPEAPFTDDNTGHSNGRDPGYSQWASFLDATGLRSVFMNAGDGLMRAHPGCQKLNRSHLLAFKAADAAYRIRNPQAIAGACECTQCSWHPNADAVHDPLLDFNLCRLTWLIWWTEYALTNCERPAIYNY